MENNELGFGGGGMWIFALLILLLLGGGFGGFGANRNTDSALSTYATAASQQEILFGQQFGNLDNKIDRLGNGIADSTYALTNSINGVGNTLGSAINNEGRALQMQIANCCCENQKNVDSVRYDMANFNAATQAAIHAEGEATRNLLQQNKIETLQAQVNQLQMAQALCGVPKIAPYGYGIYQYQNGCGCNNI